MITYFCHSCIKIIANCFLSKRTMESLCTYLGTNKLFQPKHPWCKNVAAKNLKKGHAEKDVKSKWAVKASCC